MAARRGWWHLELENNSYNDLENYDLEHIAECIKDGCWGGEIVETEKEDYDEVTSKL